MIIKRLFQHFRIRVPKWIVSWLILVTDTISGYIAYAVVIQPVMAKLFPSTIEQLLIWLVFQSIWNFLFLVNGLYKGEFSVSRMYEIETMLKITFITMVLYVFIDALRFVSFPVNARGMFRYWLIFMFFALSSRFLIRTLQKYLLFSGIGREKTVILGYNRRGFSVADYLSKHEDQGYDLVGFVRAEDDPLESKDYSDIPVLGNEQDIGVIVRNNEVSDIVLALEKPDHTRILGVMQEVNGSPVTIKIVPDLYDALSGLVRTHQIAGLPLTEVNLNYTNWYQRGLKRIFDYAVTLPVLLAFLPFGILIAVAIKLESKGPIFYRQERVGMDDNRFQVIKFRSMKHNAEDETGPVWAAHGDPRITKVGKLLRRFRLDEVPQFLNVLTGDMSVIGPRPERPYFIEQLAKEFPFYHRRSAVRPGISGWAQIKQSYDVAFEDVRQKLKYDFYYIENLSFGLDLKILLSTIWVIFSGQGR